MSLNRVTPRHGLDYTPSPKRPRRIARLVAGLAVTAIGVGGVAVASASTGIANASLGVASTTEAAAPTATRSIDVTSRSQQREALASTAEAAKESAAAQAAEEKAAEKAAAKKKEAAEKKEAAKKAAAKKKAATKKAAAKKKAAEEAAKKASLPVASSDYRISAAFGETGSWSSYHTGLDFAAGVGTTVRAIVAGTVISDSVGSWSGNHIVIQAADGTYTLYCHLSAEDVEIGDKVAAGDKIGAVGETGRAFGAHLHLEYYTADQTPGDIYSASDPGKYLAKLGLDV